MFLQFWIMACAIQGTFQLSFEKYLTLTTTENKKLDEFKELVIPFLSNDWMKEDIYLVSWLRARKFNIPLAKEMLMENIKWRTDNNIDNILKENWTKYENEYKFAIEGCDKEGRPVVSVPVGDWHIRKAVIAGKDREMMRYFDYLFEKISVLIRESQNHGQNITQYDFIFEMSNYNVIMQGCLRCISVYVHLFQSYENHYPGAAHKTVLVNVPDIFLSLWQVVNPFLSSETTNTISLYGKDKAQWQSVLREFVDKTHLSKEFGGLKQEPLSLEDLYDANNVQYFKCSDYAFKEN